MNPITAKVTSKGPITIPAPLRAKFDIQQGDTIVFKASDGSIMLRKEKPLNDFHSQILMSGAADEWDSEEDNAAFNGL